MVSKQPPDEDLKAAEELMSKHLKAIFSQNKDQDLLTGMEILHKLVTKYDLNHS